MDKNIEITKTIHNILGLDPLLQSKIIASVCIFLLFLITRHISIKILKSYILESKKLYFWRRTITYTLFIFILFLLGQLWFAENFSMGTFLGLISGALTIVYKEVLLNIAGGIYIFSRSPFKIGDRIEIAGHKGDVIDIGLMSFLLVEIGNWAEGDQGTGRVIHVPASNIFSNSLFNYTMGFEYIWNEIPVMITLESNWKKAKKLLYEIVKNNATGFVSDASEQMKKAAQEYAIMYRNLDPTIYTTVCDSGVVLTLRFLIKPRRKREIEELMWEDILNAFSEHKDIHLAYRTNRVYRDCEENVETIKALKAFKESK